MPRSRNRRTRHVSARTLKLRRQARARESRRQTRDLIATLRPGQSVEHLLTEEDWAHQEAARQAAARGEAHLAWEHTMAGAVVEESLTHHCLRELADLGDDGPGWMYSRWGVGEAYRWMLLKLDPRIDETRRIVLIAAHSDYVASVLNSPEPSEAEQLRLVEYGTVVAATDWLAQQYAVYECDGLLDYLDLVAEPGLLDRADNLRAWADAAMGVYTLQPGPRGVLIAHDLVDDTTTEVLNIGALAEREAGQPVLGRIVPISVAPFRMFESRPVSVDEATAYDAARRIAAGDRLGWLEAIFAAREEGRLPRGFSWGQATLYSSDIVPERASYDAEPEPHDELPPRVLELLDAGLDEFTASGVMVAEVALVGVGLSEEAAGVLGPHVSAVLVEPRLLDAVTEHCTAPEHEAAWRTLAEHTTSPVRERCLELADACRRKAA